MIDQAEEVGVLARAVYGYESEAVEGEGAERGRDG